MAKLPSDMPEVRTTGASVKIDECDCFTVDTQRRRAMAEPLRQTSTESARTRISKRCNLNFAELNTDGLPEVIRDYATTTRDVSVYFREIESALIREIECADYVFGCVAWFTNKNVLGALAAKAGVSIVVQKEDFLRPDTGAMTSWKVDLHRLYKALPSVPRHWFDGMLGGMSMGGDLTCDAVRCVGVSANRRNTPPRSHHKFAVFCKAVTCEHGNEIWSPYAVWTGSFNWTENAVHSLENAVVIRDRAIVEAFYAEFQQVAALSEPLDWSSEYVAPEWRIGT